MNDDAVPGVGQPGAVPGDDAVDGEGGERALAAALEAVLMVVDAPVEPAALARATGATEDEVRAELDRLAAACEAEGRGFELRQAGGGWRYASRPEHAEVVERFVLDGQTARLSSAALETLAVVAYRQPVSRARIAAVRGVSVDAVVRTLLTRGLVTEVGSDPATGAVLYGTTPAFLERTGLRSLDDLPDLAPLLPPAPAADADLDLDL